MSKTIVIVSVTGIQGSSVTHAFFRFLKCRVRGITRSPSSEASQALAAKGVEMIKAILMINFFSHLFDALSSPDSLAGRTLNEHAYYGELEQSINIAEAAASGEVLKTLERFVLSSLSDARKWSSGKYTTVYHYGSKAEMVRVIKARFPKLAASMSALQFGHYATNWKTFPAVAPQKQLDASFLTLRPVGPEVQFPFVVTQKDTGAFVKALVNLPPGNDLLGVSETMTWPEWMALWGRVLGVEAGFKQVSGDEFFLNVPAPLKK